MRRKTYVLDTSVLVSVPDVLVKLGGCRIVIPIAVIGELDRFKSLPDARDPRAVAARRVARALDRLGSKEDISRGARTPSGSTVMIYRSHALVRGLSSAADCRLVGAALKLKRAGRAEVVVLSNDGNLRNVARAHGITATAYPFPPDHFHPAACGIRGYGKKKEKTGRCETVNPEPGRPLAWQYLLVLVAVIVVLILLTAGR